MTDSSVVLSLSNIFQAFSTFIILFLVKTVLSLDKKVELLSYKITHLEKMAYKVSDANTDR